MFVYLTTCNSCEKTSMHLTFEDLPTKNINRTMRYRFEKEVFKYDEEGNKTKIFDLKELDLDDQFFYSVPTSFFTVNEKIPKILRELLTEAEGCLKSNYLTGASVCARKIIYELARFEKAEGENYDERIKSLKGLKKEVDESFFDTLLTIQQVTSSKVHEQSYDKWQAKHLKLILSTLAEILKELYVIPAIREEQHNTILKLKNEVLK